MCRVTFKTVNYNVAKRLFHCLLISQMNILIYQINIDKIDVICGISLGGKIVHEIWKSGKIKMLNLIIDGAPLVKCPKLAVNIMINNYKSIIHKSKLRDAKVIENHKKYFLPEKYLESY